MVLLVAGRSVLVPVEGSFSTDEGVGFATAVVVEATATDVKVLVYTMQTSLGVGGVAGVDGAGGSLGVDGRGGGPPGEELDPSGGPPGDELDPLGGPPGEELEPLLRLPGEELESCPSNELLNPSLTYIWDGRCN